MTDTCKTCRWWDGCEEQLVGFCRKNAPRLSGQACPHGNSTHQNPMRAAWPETDCADWCGEHTPADQGERGETA